MIISHKHKFIFVKPTKVAGTSIEVNLAKQCGKKDIITQLSKYSTNNDETHYTHKAINHKGYYNHMKPKEIKKKIGKKIWENYFKFTVVRNPYDLVVSRYYWEKIRDQKNHINNLIKVNYTSPKQLFFGLYTAIEHKIIYKDFNNLIQYYKAFWKNTDYYFNEEWQPIMDAYIKFEDLEKGYEQICSKLNITYEKLPKLKTKIRNSKKHYSKYYNKKSKKIVEKMFKKEISFFDYSFEKEKKST